MTPNKDLELYNQLAEYQNIADDMKRMAESDMDISLKEKQDILYPMIDEIKEIADRLIDNYVIYIKNKSDVKQTEILKEDITTILEMIDLFKNRVYDIYELKRG